MLVGCTPFHEVIQGSQHHQAVLMQTNMAELIETAELLLEARADLCSADSLQRTPLHLVAAHHDTRLLEHLLPYLTEEMLVLGDMSGAPALHVAAEQGQLAPVQVLGCSLV